MQAATLVVFLGFCYLTAGLNLHLWPVLPQPKNVVDTGHGATPSYPAIARTLTVTNGNSWGSWGNSEFCPKGSFATAFQLKIANGCDQCDNTAVNGIKLICTTEEGGNPTAEITSAVGPFGEWRNKESCAAGMYMFGFSMKVQEYQGAYKDDLAVDNMSMWCMKKPEYGRGRYTLPGMSGFTSEGAKWDVSYPCPVQSGICGIQTRVQGNRGDAGDDTALNNVKMFCRRFHA